MSAPVLRVAGLAKTFVLHTQGGVKLPVFADLALDVAGGECVVLGGPSGCGKSSLLRSLYANYKPSAGEIWLWHDHAWLDLAAAPPRVVLAVRERTLGHVSQFLRVIPRISALHIVAAAVPQSHVDRDAALEQAKRMLARLNLPQRLWSVPPATFSGGEQQRVNIARCFVRPYPVLLLDEPTASLDRENRAVVIELIQEAKARGTAIVGIFHDAAVREVVATGHFDVTRYRSAA